LRLTNETVKDRQAFDYFVTLAGVMVEELVLLWDSKLEVASGGCDWPLTKHIENNQEFRLPGLWIL
jgi:hypothetical protein